MKTSSTMLAMASRGPFLGNLAEFGADADRYRGDHRLCLFRILIPDHSIPLMPGRCNHLFNCRQLAISLLFYSHS